MYFRNYRLWKSCLDREFATPNSNAIIWKTKSFFSIFCSIYWNLRHILNILKEKMIVIPNVFPKLQTVKNLFRTLSKGRRFSVCFDSQHVKASEILVKSPWARFYNVFSSFSGKLICKTSPLVLRQILGVFVNTLTGGGKYPVQNYQNLPLPIQM